MGNLEKRKGGKKMRKTATFMIGAPGAGKSRVAKEKFADRLILDCDTIKEQHPEYHPKNPGDVHEWSKVVLEEEFQAQIKKEESFVMDGTGANSDKMVRRMTEAKEEGFIIELFYVTVPLEVALERNAKRKRTVPKSVVIEKWKDIKYSFELVAPHASNITVINNP